MITYYNVFLIFAAVGVRCQHVLKEYAPDHDNYESYSFAYGVSDPISGDHKHQWERMDNGHVRGEYALMEPDGMMRLVQYTAGPRDGFQAKVMRLAVQVARPDYTHGRELYQQDGQYEGTRYAAEDTSELKGINQNKENIVGNEQPEYVKLDYGQKVNQENKIENDYVNQESQHHAIISRSPKETHTQNQRRKVKPSSNSTRKHIVKKNIDTALHSIQPGFTGGGIEYISNFNLNPLNIQQLNIPQGEKNILHGLSSVQENNQQRFISPLDSPRPFTLQSIQSPSIHPALIKFQNEIGNVQLNGYQIMPNSGTVQQAELINQRVNSHALPLIQNNPQIHQGLPVSIQDVKTQQGIDSSYNDRRLQNALALIHEHPEVKTRLENLHNIHNIPQDQQHVIQLANEQVNYQDPRIPNGNYHGYSELQQIPVQGSSNYEPTLEGKRYNNENQTVDEKEEERLYLLGLRPLNIPQSTNQQYVQNQEQYSNQNIPQQVYSNGNPNYGDYQQNHPELTYERTKLNSQNHYPVVLLDPRAKFGLPFYPSSQAIHQIPDQEYNYEGIPLFGPNLEGRRYNNENQTEEEKAQQRQYLLGLTQGPLFPPPPGYTRETIWQAGDPDADPEPEILVRQLNETCAYIQLNETTPGTEDGRDNIWQAGDYSAQREEEELIRSVNITCENYTADAMSNFSSGYTVVDYCWQCARIDEAEYEQNNNEQQQQQVVYVQDEGQQQAGYVLNNGNSGQQIADQNNAQQQAVYVQPNTNSGQTQQSYETSVENYSQQQLANDSPQNYDNSQGGQNYYQQGQGPMKVALYTNLGYRNDPQNGEYGLYRRRSTRTENRRNVTDSKTT